MKEDQEGKILGVQINGKITCLVLRGLKLWNHPCEQIIMFFTKSASEVVYRPLFLRAPVIWFLK